MGIADKYFRETCEKIIYEGISSEGKDVRAKWEDGTPAHTKKIFGVVNRYDIQKEFPMLTLRKVFFKSAVDELLWIWQKKSNNINELRSKIWDQWADDSGSIGSAYGYQVGIKYRVSGVRTDALRMMFNEFALVPVKFPDCPNRITDEVLRKFHAVLNLYDNSLYMDQIDKALYDLLFNPTSRRILLTTWNPQDNVEMHLQPCAYSLTLNVCGNRLNAILNQRSQDMLAANGWNVAQYAAFVMLLAKVSGLVPGELIHVISDCHIYDRHIPLVKELISLPEYESPKVTIDSNIRNFYDCTPDSFRVENYKYNDFNHSIPIAV